MAHPFSNRPDFDGLSDALFGFAPPCAVAAGVVGEVRALVRRLSDANGGDMSLWAGYHRNCAAAFATLRDGSDAEAAALLGNIFATPLTHGLAQGHEVYASLQTNPAARMHVGAITLDRFYRLAEAVGARAVLSAEHGQRVIAVQDLDAIWGRVEDAIGAALPSTRHCGGLFGVRLRGSIYSDRHFDGIYAAWRARTLARDAGIAAPSMLELGGGAGFLCFYARQLGFSTTAIIDLDQARIVQYAVLASEHTPKALSLERKLPGGTYLAGPSSPDLQDFSGWSVVVNVDSLPEMGPPQARNYMERLQPGQTLLSINQESGVSNGAHPQNIVSDLAVSLGLNRRSRSPAWLRTGFVEEIFEKS